MPTDAAADIQDDDDRELVVSRRAQIELDAHVDDRHDDAAQIDDALDEFRRIRDAGHRLVAADLLHFQDVDAVFFLAQRKGQKFIAAASAPDYLRALR